MSCLARRAARTAADPGPDCCCCLQDLYKDFETLDSAKKVTKPEHISHINVYHAISRTSSPVTA
jgi:hypothetical protein